MDNNSIPQDEISVDVVKEALDSKTDVVRVDVRTPEEYEEGHIEGSVLVPVLELEKHLALDKIPDKGKIFHVYCRRGVRGARAVEILKGLGYINVHNMTGGIESWMEKNYPIQK